MGDPYFEVRSVPSEIDYLKVSLEKDSPFIKWIHKCLMDHSTGFLFYGKPLMERPSIGSGVRLARLVGVHIDMLEATQKLVFQSLRKKTS